MKRTFCAMTIVIFAIYCLTFQATASQNEIIKVEVNVLAKNVIVK